MKKNIKMNNFKTKKIGKVHNLANRLKQARLEKGLSLTDVQKEINIQIKYLEILEKGDYEKLPGSIYVRSWLKLYGNLLELPVSELLEDYKTQNIVNKKLQKITNESNKNKIYDNLLKPKVIKVIIVAFIFLSLLFYLAWSINNIISPPYINIIEPEDNYKTMDSVITIYGNTIPESQLTINSEIVLLDKDGNFEKEINLMIGLNYLEINAKKKYSKIKEIKLNILREVN